MSILVSIVVSSLGVHLSVSPVSIPDSPAADAAPDLLVRGPAPGPARSATVTVTSDH